MKKVLFLIFASLLVLGACGQEEEKKEKDNKTETTKKSEKKETQKKTDDKKENKEDKTKENTDNNDQQSNEQQDNQVNEQQQAQEQQANQQEPSFEEQMRANAKVAKQNGYTGIPNGDMGGVPTSDKAYSNDQLDPETGLPKDDAVPQDTE